MLWKYSGEEKFMTRLKELTGAILVFVIGTLVGYSYCKHSAAAPQQIQAFSIENIAQKYLTKDVNLLVYLSSSCQSCIQTEESINRLADILDGYVDILLVFKEKAIDETMLPYIVVTQEQYIAEQYPYYFIVDSNCQVILATNDTLLAIDQIFAKIHAESDVLEANAIDYLRKRYGNDKDTLVYFAMSGCADCIAAEQILETSNRIRNEFSVESIYRYNETNQSKEIDRFKILQNALRIDWYPTFVKLYSTGEYEIVRKVQLDKLEENIATSNKAVLEQ